MRALNWWLNMVATACGGLGRLGDGQPSRMSIEERLTQWVIGAFFEVFNTLGHGFLEHV